MLSSVFDLAYSYLYVNYVHQLLFARTLLYQKKIAQFSLKCNVKTWFLIPKRTVNERKRGIYE